MEDSSPGRKLELLIGDLRRCLEQSAAVDDAAVGRALAALEGEIAEVTSEGRLQEEVDRHRRLAALGQLTAGMAHDLNNILTVVVGVAEHLRAEGRVSKTAREKIALIAEQGHRASDLIRQISDFSRRTATTDRRRLDLRRFLEEALPLLSPEIPSHITVTTEIPAGRHEVRADRVQLQQVIANLLSNAVDSVGEGGEIRIQLRGFRLESGAETPLPGLSAGDWETMQVTDNGSGMSAEVLPHVFEPFFTTKETGKGRGLGLAQAYGLVKQNGGFIDVSSRAGQGTAVTVYLPALAADELEPTPLPKPRAAPRLVVILIAEDDAAVRAVMQWQLEGMGYRVLTASSGEESVRLLRGQGLAPDLAVVDLEMPGMGGATLCRTLRQSQPELPVIVFSGYSVESLSPEDRATLSTNVEWLEKPAALAALAAAVQRRLGQS